MNVGDYVRTKTLSGQGKIAKLEKIDDICITDTGAIDKNNIIKSSPQIIDLIEENDYIRIITDTDFRRIYNSYGKLVIYRGKELPIETFSNDFISEIITHEQMEAMQYRVEE